jgi:hypothetical protein
MMDATTLLAEIRWLYRALSALPSDERPVHGGNRAGSRYRALEAQIRELSARYQAIDPSTRLQGFAVYD